ncbi:MAG: hypothetical protein LV480_01120 [Methylacidiphilales bacterium]|nr:hypothetical protein [Candidatus Methylacidiphilales bacterium]
MSAQQQQEVTALILAWDSAPFANKRDAKKALIDYLRGIQPDATDDEIEDLIRFFRNRYVKEAKRQQTREDTPRVQK